MKKTEPEPSAEGFCDLPEGGKEVNDTDVWRRGTSAFQSLSEGCGEGGGVLESINKQT